ncbi:MAG: hypothetical protein IK086_04785, partial [Clostridia bacterium]|nr:hypothetical protein [Clostridia bacterium]
LNGLAGVRAGDGDSVTVNPLFAPDDLDYFCADGILYHGNSLSVLWDKTGERYNAGKGFKVFLNGNQVFAADTPCKFEVSL